jgi:ribonucleotide reductase beta subunit family protein with ferritin-like domain
VDKILSDHRKQLGNFEIIDWVDEDELSRLRGKLDVDAPVELNWTWEYGSEVEELRTLYEKGKQGQWNAAQDVDWSAPVSKDEWVLNPEASMLANLTKLMGKDEATQKAAAFDELAFTVSQLLHGEQAALQLCGQLTNVCDKLDQKYYAASQVADEARHVEVFARFLQEKMGTIYPIGGTLKILLEMLLQAEGMQKKTLGMQTLFEGMAVGIMDLMRQECRNDLFSDILLRVQGDEARHAAFGVLTMRRVVKEASPEEMAEMEDWSFNILEALNANQQMDMLKLFGPKYDIDPMMITQMVTSLPNFAEINSMIYTHTVVPNLRNLGLLTERTEDRWRNLGMISDTRPEEVKFELPLG